MNKQSYWDIFCKVIDNFGDIGVCWRLCTDLASRGYRIRLWVDDPSALEWMAPGGCEGVEIIHWLEPSACALALKQIADLALPQVLIEAFGCEPEASYLELIQQKYIAQPTQNLPIWINLEYLSAEKYVENCHGLSSPTSQYPILSQKKYFYYPGYTAKTGGLIRDPLQHEALLQFNQHDWLKQHQIEIAPQPEHILVSLFCYDQAPIKPLLDFLIQRNSPSTLLVTDCVGVAGLKQMLELFYQNKTHLLQIHYLPKMSQKDYSCLLHCCDLNIVRGEDSATQALWAKAPFIWQLYPQEDAYHLEKLSAFLNLFQMPASITNWFYDLNGASQKQLQAPNLKEWGQHFDKMRTQLLEQNDLCSQLLSFIDATSQA